MIVIENQSLLDIAVQEDGSVLAAFEWALANGLSITDDLTAVQNLIAPNSLFRNTDLANYFKGRNQILATAIKKPPIPPGLGIGHMRIGINFKVA